MIWVRIFDRYLCAKIFTDQSFLCFSAFSLSFVRDGFLIWAYKKIKLPFKTLYQPFCHLSDNKSNLESWAIMSCSFPSPKFNGESHKSVENAKKFKPMEILAILSGLVERNSSFNKIAKNGTF